MEKKKIKSIVIAICAVAVVAVGFLTYQSISSLMTTRKEWIQKTHQLVKVKKEVGEIERLLNFYRKEKKEFEGYLFQEKDIPGFLDGLSGFAQTAGINIIDMKTNKFQEVKVPDSMKESQSELAKRQQDKLTNGKDKEMSKEQMNRMLTLAAMPINFKIQGNYNSLVEFYRHMENFKQLVNISNIEIVTTPKYPTLECAFTLKLYSLKTLEELRGSANEK